VVVISIIWGYKDIVKEIKEGFLATLGMQSKYGNTFKNHPYLLFLYKITLQKEV